MPARPPADPKPAGDLPFIDEHRVTLDVPTSTAWTILEEHARALGVRPGGPISRLLGTTPPQGFHVAHLSPRRYLVLTGRHRFSRYRWEFHVSECATGSEIRARTYAEFPGVSGSIYRTMVITSRVHVLATRHVLQTIRKRAGGSAARSGDSFG